MREESRPDEVDELMRQLGVDPDRFAKPPSPPAEAPSAEGEIPAGPARAELEPFAPSPPEATSPPAGIDFLGDVDVQIRVELGRTRLSVQDILKLGSGSVVPLESLTTDPVDVYVNGRLVARGEVLVVNDNFAVRVTEVVTPPSPGGKPDA